MRARRSAALDAAGPDGRPGRPLRRLRARLAALGPGLVTGAADDDPSGIATYSQAGAQFGEGLLWTVVLTTPLMIAVQMASARVGWATRRGLAAALAARFPRWAIGAAVLALVAANVFNLGADLAAMAAAAQLATGSGPGRQFAWSAGFAAISLALQIRLPLERYAPLLKLMTLSLLAYVGVLGAIHIPWGKVAAGMLLPRIEWSRDYLMAIVAVLGTTISPYLFFWQASQEADSGSSRARTPPQALSATAARRQLRRIRVDTWAGMTFSNAIAFCIMLTAALTLHAHGITEVRTTADAARALEPLLGSGAVTVYCLGVVGTGMLAVPVLAGSAAYAVAETFGWKASLSDTPRTAPGFYAVLVAAVAVGLLLDLGDVDPVRQLYYAAVLNGVIAVPIMALLLLIAGQRAVMHRFAVHGGLRALGWIAVLAMGACVMALFVL